MKRSTHSGFSLVEMLVVVALIAVIGLIVAPLLRSDSLRTLNSAARAIQGNIQRARLLAQRDNRPYYVDFSRDLNGDGNLDCCLWRDLEAIGARDEDPNVGTDANGDGIPDEIVGAEALFLNTTSAPYGRAYKGIAYCTNNSGVATAPPPVASLHVAWPGTFWDTISGATLGGGRCLRVNPDGTSMRGFIGLSEAFDQNNPQQTRAAYCIVVSTTGSVQVWRWLQSSQAWQRM
jgi:prepilin-type N-terminal cleavage/methylation domain-containing protein